MRQASRQDLAAMTTAMTVAMTAKSSFPSEPPEFVIIQ